MGLIDLPFFIQKELSGPYGPSVTQKINAIIGWYKTYYGGADFDVEDMEGFEPTDFKAKNIRQLINRQAEFMVGKEPGFKVTCKDETDDDRKKEKESAVQNYIHAVLKKNKWSGKLLKGAKDCFIGAKVLLKVSVQNDRIGIMFVPADGFVYETETDDIDALTKVILFYCTKQDADKKEQRWWRQAYWMENGKCFVDEGVFDGYGEAIENIGSRDTKLDRIPCYVIVNDGLSGDLEGDSDVETIANEDSWYNKMRSANMDTIRKTMNQITYVSGASPKSFEKLSNTPGQVWDLQADPIAGVVPAVGTIENRFQYTTAYENTLSNIGKNMRDDLGVPDTSPENIQGFVTSGKGLKALYWPLICRCEAKWTEWKPALEWLADMLLYAATVFPDLKKVYGEYEADNVTITIDNQYPLPEDEAEERTLDLQEVGTGRSILSYLMEWGGPDHKGLTQTEAEAEIDQMAYEKHLLEDSYEGEIGGDA